DQSPVEMLQLDSGWPAVATRVMGTVGVGGGHAGSGEDQPDRTGAGDPGSAGQGAGAWSGVGIQGDHMAKTHFGGPPSAHGAVAQPAAHGGGAHPKPKMKRSKVTDATSPLQTCQDRISGLLPALPGGDRR